MSRILSAVVVGGGTAGCVVAETLASNGIRVHLVETGGEPVHQDTPNFFRSMHSPGAVKSQSVRTTSAVAERAYVQASVLGGGSAVNAMVSLPGDPADYDAWANEHACRGWSWNDVAPVFNSLAVPGYRAESGELGEFSERFLSVVDGAERAPLAWSSTRVSSVSRLRLAAAVHTLVETHLHSEVESLSVSNDHVTGVTLANGDAIEADAVVLCAGALATPRLVRKVRDLVDERAAMHVGEHLQDHPAVMFSCESTLASNTGFVITSMATLRDGAGRALGQLLAYNQLGGDSPRVGLGVSLLDVHSRGRIDDSNHVSFDMLSDPRDVANMRAVVRWALDTVSTTALGSLGVWTADDAGTHCSDLRSATDADIDAWLLRNVGFQSHACGSCRMGDTPSAGAVSTSGELFGARRVWVADASVFPRIPRANTNLPAMMVAARVAESIAGGV